MSLPFKSFRFSVVAAVVLIASSLSITAQETAQETEPQLWQGVLDVQGETLTLNFEITKTGDEYSGTIATPEQGNKKMPISGMTIQDKQVTIESKRVKASFVGTLNDEGNLVTGTWTQRGNDYDLELKMVDKFVSGEHIELWRGALDAGLKLEMGLNIYREDDGTLIATLDSYTQGATGIPVEFERDGDTYKMSHKAMMMEYEGTLNEDKTELKGIFKQAGNDVELIMKKSDLDSETEMPTFKRPQNPKEPYSYDATDVTYENKTDSITLAGTLTTPKGDGPFPAAILISGSGAQNRNEEILGHKPFLVIADHLTRNGIAVLRFDDRGTAESTGDFAAANSSDFAKDVQSGIDFLRTHGKIDAAKIGLIGHSEGGLIAPMVAAERDDVAFIVLLAGPGVNGAKIIESQGIAMMEASGEAVETIASNRQILEIVMKMVAEDPNLTAEKIDEACKAFVENIEDEALRKKMEKGLESSGAAFTSPWMSFFLRYDPTENLGKVKCPILALNGAKDLQVLADLNLNAIRKAVDDGGVNLHYSEIKFDDMNHLFQETDGPGLPTEYGSIEQTFSPKALDAMTEWIASFSKTGAK